MKKIAVIYDGTVYTYRWLSALLAAKNEFEKLGYEISIPGLFHSIKQNNAEKRIEKINSVDILMLAFHPGGVYFKPINKVMKIVKMSRNKCKKLIWLDTSDSAGTTFFEVLPYVDKYLKKQLYVDLDLYNKPLCRDRLFCEYYSHRNDVSVGPEDAPNNIQIPDKERNKLGLSWNVGLGILFERNKYRFMINMDRKKNYITYEPPHFEKKFDIFYRGSLYNSITGFQRKLAIDGIEALDCSHPNPKVKVSQKEYDEEIRDSKTILSPFGWGEICTRDFEAFKNGALLIKPDMSHLRTFPDYYQDGKTFVSINWDFSDLEEKLNSVLSNREMYYSVSAYAQNMYKNTLSSEGKQCFAIHLLNEIGEKR